MPPARTSHTAQGTHLIAPRVPPRPHRGNCADSVPLFSKKDYRAARPERGRSEVALGVRVSRPPHPAAVAAVVTARAAVVTAVMTATHAAAGVGVAGRRGVGVLPRRREDRANEQQREDQRDCKFLHWVGFSFSGIVGQPYFFFGAGPAGESRPAAPYLVSRTPTVATFVPAARDTPVRVFASFLARARRAAPSSLWHLCSAPQNRHTDVRRAGRRRRRCGGGLRGAASPRGRRGASCLR